MMTSKEALYKYLGSPDDYTFNINDYKGPRGLRNILGLRHNNNVIAGNVLFNMICEYFDVDLDRWNFLHELGLWCRAYIKSDKVQVGKQAIIRGQIEQGSSRYYCIPAEALAQYTEDSQVAN